MLSEELAVVFNGRQRQQIKLAAARQGILRGILPGEQLKDH
jgi:hypothetical protein